MSDPPAPTPPLPENQRQRWLKYGTNVILSSLIVILIAAGVIYLIQGRSVRIDMTSMKVYSLKPQTINLISDLKQPIKIVSLYQKPESGALNQYALLVSDLLDEYHRKGRNIEVETVDPVAQPSKVDDLITEVTSKYGGEVAKYRAVIDAYSKTYDQLNQITEAEGKKVSTLPLDKLQGNAELQDSVGLALITVQQFPQNLKNLKERVEKITKQKLPDYRGAVDSIQSGMEILSAMAGQTADDFKKFKDDAKVPAELRAYMAESLPRYEQTRKLANDLVEQIKKLGSLKLEDLRQSLRARDTILVMGASDMRVIPAEQVWQTDKDLRNFDSSANLKPKFAGEQQISTAILGLTMGKKPKVCFIRPGGPPLTTAGNPFQRGGPLSRVANRLREYNFEVLEKDLSGSYAMQAQMQGQFAEKEPGDEDIKDAVWIVVAYPLGGGPMQETPTQLGPKVEAHLKAGGSAMIVVFPNGEDFASALKDWGIEPQARVIAVHERIELAEGGGDELEQVRRLPFVFVLSDYGDHVITKPLRSLEGLMAPILSVKTHDAKDVKITPLLPVPMLPKSWGETDISALESDRSAKYEPDKGDQPGPIWGGAAAEKQGAGRIVVFGAPQFMFNGIVSEPDPAMWKKGFVVARFPGNAELFTNSVFWLAKMETMLAISPAAMEAPRIASMDPAVLRFWRVGVLVGALPLAALLTGLAVYFARRD